MFFLQMTYAQEYKLPICKSRRFQFITFFIELKETDNS